MAAPPDIPVAILDIPRRLTADEVALYRVDCPAGPIFGQNVYGSGWPAFAQYGFELPSCIMDGERLYTLTIRLRANLLAPQPAAAAAPRGQAPPRRRNRRSLRRRSRI